MNLTNFYTSISTCNTDVIHHARRSLLFDSNHTCIKKQGDSGPFRRFSTFNKGVAKYNCKYSVTRAMKYDVYFSFSKIL